MTLEEEINQLFNKYSLAGQLPINIINELIILISKKCIKENEKYLNSPLDPSDTEDMAIKRINKLEEEINVRD